MDYEKIIVELLSRIQTLEEQVAILTDQQMQKKEKAGKKMTTNDIREYICELKRTAKTKGERFLVLRSGNIHKDLNLKDSMPPVCNAMRQSTNPGDVVLHTTASGNSSTIEIQYKL